MAFTRKVGPPQALSLIGQPPPIPRLPDDVTERFESFSKWESDFQQWWNDYSGMVQRDMDSIRTRFAQDETNASSSLVVINTTLTSLAQQISALSGSTGTSMLAVQIVAVANQVATVLAQLTSHIQAYAAHGTTGHIVGTTDSQDLDSKTIGKTDPGYGRFVAGAIGRRTVLGSDSINIGPDDQLVVAGPLDVTGLLTVEGTLLVL